MASPPHSFKWVGEQLGGSKVTKGFIRCPRIWCLRKDVFHRSGVECAAIEELVSLADMYFKENKKK